MKWIFVRLWSRRERAIFKKCFFGVLKQLKKKAELLSYHQIKISHVSGPDKKKIKLASPHVSHSPELTEAFSVVVRK